MNEEVTLYHTDQLLSILLTERQAKGLNQEVLASKSGILQPSVSKIFIRRSLNFEQALKLTESLGLELIIRPKN